MIANPDKFKAIVLTKTDHNTAGIRLELSGKTILSSNEIDLLGVTTDTKLNFDSHITIICRKASRQLNALKRLGFYIPLNVKFCNPLSFPILKLCGIVTGGHFHANMKVQTTKCKDNNTSKRRAAT